MMSSVSTYQAWITECQQLIDTQRKRKLRKRVLAALAINAILKQNKRPYKKSVFGFIHYTNYAQTWIL